MCVYIYIYIYNIYIYGIFLRVYFLCSFICFDVCFNATLIACFVVTFLGRSLFHLLMLSVVNDLVTRWMVKTALGSFLQ